MTIFQSFLQYWFTDVIPSPYYFFNLRVADGAEEATSFFVLILLFGSLFSSLVAGKLADLYGTKPVIYASGFFLAISLIIVAFVHPFTFVIFMGIIHGLGNFFFCCHSNQKGYGGYISVIFALATNTLPSKKTFGKDLAIWSLAETTPQIFAPIIAGGMLDFLQERGKERGVPDLGKKTIFQKITAKRL
jgi:MFS family permease